ncbi:DNA mismatch repair endonuclease MutL [Carboxylicivirga sediminis]|uniref:DNA mismatch repair protein MutL n=1 Tax=Carboxylicivirga sediminis TaxID=2006564 RepID=A0A941F533_9BACT|nr:DNA mismatch repair endonuclease MutL [Carboxylicivirga sediminis]MBR8536537.1 DNA mismatch repair endonuclease MutL [Carboxylicivirga sediminis]
MSNVIQLLPDSVANQIAAGEVIQRPASVIKELMENAIDAGATNIQVITRDAGKSLIQVIDNGCGMNETDARMAFERHATSKIREASDLFALQTMGFRGEALASIAAIAQVELKTRREEDDLGVQINIAASQVESQEPVQCPVGSQFCIKNLFYNVPARRRFLKKTSTELRHIINEFQRVALAHPDVALSLVHNEVPMFSLPAGNIKQRIVNMNGKQMGNNIIPIDTDTVMVKISGFIGKPESAKKTMGDQFFFVNNRFMKHPYLHRAVMDAYDNILQPETIPAYFIFLEVDPQIIDVNIHPTKTEIKFEDERAFWQLLNAAIRESLGKFNMMPSIDFDTTDQIHIPVSSREGELVEPTVEVNPFYNPFEEERKQSVSSYSSGGTATFRSKASAQGWENLYDGNESNELPDFSALANSEMEKQEQPFEPNEQEQEPVQQTFLSGGANEESAGSNRFFQLKNRYILTSVKSGLMMIDQKRAHERIIFEGFIRTLQRGASLSQKCLFPEELHFGPEEMAMVNELQPDLLTLGLELQQVNEETFNVLSTPAGLENVSAAQLIDGILTDFRDGEVDLQKEVTEQVATSMARRGAIPYGKVLSTLEMSELFDQLFACMVPNFSPSGKTIISIMDMDEMQKRFM